MRILITHILFLLSISFVVGNNSSNKNSVIDWDRVEKFTNDSLSKHLKGKHIYPNWINNSHYFYYDIVQQGENNYYLVNAKNGKKSRLIKDNESFARHYNEIIGDTLKPNNIKIYGIQFKDNNFSRFYIRKNGKYVMYNTKTGKLTEVPYVKETVKKEYKMGSYHSIDSLYTMLGSGYNLFIRNNTNNTVKQITFDGKEHADYTYRNTPDTLENNANGFWAGKRYIYLMRDQSEIEDMSITFSLKEPRPTTSTFKMPMPGDSGVRQYRLFWYDAEKDEAKTLPIEKYPDQQVDMDYYRSDEALFITRRSRKADKIDLCRINVKDGTVTELISETTTPHMNLTLFNYKILQDGKYFIWWSERTGKGNYYLYNEEGKLLNRITQGENLVAGNILHVDTIKNEIIFSGYGNEEGINPYYRLYYKASLDGKHQTLLTPGNGNHQLSFSDDKKYAVDTWSRMDMPPVVNVLSIDNPKNNFEIERTPDESLRLAGWSPPKLLKVKSVDGETDLYGLMYLPSNIDKTKKYPIISNVYPGPQDDQIPQSFTLDDNGNQALAELGFVVINVAPRGSSPLRGQDFYCFSYGNLRDYPLADDKHVIEQLAKEYPFIDLDRVGIYGHSGGGFQAATAILTYPDFYKVAVSASGNHDNNIYIRWWGETFHGVDETVDPETGETKFSSEIPTNIELAENLKGKLFLITGEVDKNVPPSSTYRLANALIEANKRFDMFIFPGVDHGLYGSYYQNLIRYYFIENLLNLQQDHIDIINHN